MKIGILTASISRNAGGLFDAIKDLCLTNSKTKYQVFGLKDEFTNTDSSLWENIDTIAYKTILNNSFGYSLGINKISKEKNIEILHLHGIWMYTQYVALQWQIKFKKPVVISPHGMLDPWAINNSKWKKKLVGYLFANKSLQNADCIHALCYSEYLAIRQFGLSNPVAIIPNGINLPRNEISKNFKKSKKTILFLGRIHPKKGLIHLLKAICLLKVLNPKILENWSLKIGGWSQLGHESELKQKCNDFGINDFVHFIGPQFGSDKTNLLSEVDAFILPSYSEGLPMSILEAWAYKLPVLMTRECNIPSGFKNNAAIEINRDSKILANQLIAFMNKDVLELEELSQNGFDLVKDNFTWEVIANQTNSLYNWLLEKEEKPGFVNLV